VRLRVGLDDQAVDALPELLRDGFEHLVRTRGELA
jgi:hypothetical protein